MGSKYEREIEGNKERKRQSLLPEEEKLQSKIVFLPSEEQRQKLRRVFLLALLKSLLHLGYCIFLWGGGKAFAWIESRGGGRERE